jgi:hypothetical protein
MSALQIRLLAVAMWLVALVLLIPPLALYEEWTPYRDGKRVTADVVEVKARRKSFEVTASYGGAEQATVYTRERPGATLELVVPANRHAPILASRLDERRPSPWLLVMVAALPFTIWLGVLLWRAPTRAKRRRAARTSPLDAIVDAVRFTRNVSVGLGLFFAASAAFMAIIPLFDDEGTLGMVIAIEGLALMSIALAVWCFRRALRLGDPRRNEVMDLIERRPQELAWFYVEETRAQLGQRGYSLHLWKTDGKQIALNLVAEDIDAVLAAIARHAPAAKQGWTPEIAKAYKQNPRGSLNVPSQPDHTVIFVPALAFLIASAIGAALLIAKAAGLSSSRLTSETHQIADDFIAGVARSFGMAGSIAVSAALVVGCATWFVIALRRYRAVTRRAS